MASTIPKEILEGLRLNSLSPMEEMYIDGAVCPNCGAHEMYPLRGNRAQCRRCLMTQQNIETIVKGGA